MKQLLLTSLTLLLLTTTTFAQKRNNLSRCIDHSAFYNQTLKVVINVKPASNMEWKFPEAPSVVAERILNDLNDNKLLVKFKEPNGTLPNYIIDVTMSETNEGTRQDQASVEVIGPPDDGVEPGPVDSVTVFREKSGEAPYNNWQDAVDHLSINMVGWFETGWRGVPPCIQADGSVRQRH